MSAQPTGREIYVGARATQWSPLRCQGDVYFEFYLVRVGTGSCPWALNKTFVFLSTIGRETNVGSQKGSFVP